MYPTVPANIAAGPLSTLIPLYILQIGGGILDVSYALTLSGIMSVLGVFIWGYVTDILNKRKALIVFTYVGTTLLIASLFFIHNILNIILVYSIISFVSAASATPLNLLVMENGAKKIWAHDFAKLQMFIGIGVSIGLIIASAITGFTSLENLIVVLTASSLISFFMALRLIREPKVVAKVASISDNIHYFVARLAAAPMMLIRIPHTPKFMHIFSFKGIRGLERSFIIRFYAVSFLFYLGSSIFNTEYPAALNLSAISQSGVFFIIILGNVVQTIIFYYYDYFAKGSNRKTLSYSALFARGSLYVVIGVVFLTLVHGKLFDLANIIFFTSASGICYAIYYTTSYAIFFDSIKGESRGRTIGIYSTLAGVGTFLGAIISGGIAVSYGFATTFMFAGLLMFICSGLFTFLPKIR